MSMQRMLIVGELTLGLSVLSLTSPAYGAEQEPIVIDDLSLSQLRSEIEKIQAEYYRVFNTLNEDDELDIECQKFTPTGSNIPQVGCEPKFVTKRRGDNANDYRQGTDELLSSDGLIKDQQQNFERLTAKMNEIMGESEYFRELNQILQMLRARLRELE